MQPGEPDFSALAPPEEEQTPAPGGLHALWRAILLLMDWLGDRVEDVGHWAANLVRYLPSRLARVVTTVAVGIVSAVTFFPVGAVVLRRGGAANYRAWLRARGRQGLLRLIQLLFELIDVAGAPELFAFAWRILTRCSPLSGPEIAAAASVLGPGALRYQDVRVAQGGVLLWVFRANGGRAFATFHTVNLPEDGGHTRDHVDIVVHELVHVYQYERAGSRYIAESLLAQQEEGYGYGGAEGLVKARSVGKKLRNFNREQQAQIGQDYYSTVRAGLETSAFEPFISELRGGRV